MSSKFFTNNSEDEDTLNIEIDLNITPEIVITETFIP